MKIQKYRAFEKWLMQVTKGNKDAMFFALHGELYKQNEIVFEWLESCNDLIKLSEIIIKRNSN